MPRKCENWIQSFMEWSMPRSESPENYLFWTGLFSLAAVIRKHVKIPRKYLGGWECFPNIYLILVGPPGVARKSTTQDFGDSIIRKISNLPASPTIVTQASLMTELVESIDGSIYISVGELASLIQKSKTEMYEFLTDGYDTRKPITGRTIYRGKEEVANPCINLFACTQPVWIQENMPSSVITGGFARRAIFVFEDAPRQYQMYYNKVIENAGGLEKFDKLEEDLINDLEYISTIEGEFEIPDDAHQFMEDWYQTNARKTKHVDPRIQGYWGNRHVHAHKIAMLLHLAWSDELVLHIEDFKMAIACLENIEKRLLSVFSHIGKNTYSLDLDAIREFIKNRGSATKADIHKSFQATAAPKMIDELIGGLIKQESVIAILEDGELVLRYNDKNNGKH